MAEVFPPKMTAISHEKEIYFLMLFFLTLLKFFFKVQQLVVFFAESRLSISLKRQCHEIFVFMILTHLGPLFKC